MLIRSDIWGPSRVLSITNKGGLLLFLHMITHVFVGCIFFENQPFFQKKFASGEKLSYSDKQETNICC